MEADPEPHPSSSGSNSGYAFITHSQETLPLNLPPSIDNATLARRRRRRTSAHDQAILEEEYRKCDRPDKSKRREITAKVQMGEKEVQIWFQNKRQSTRRKSKPLLPHEIIPHNSQNSSSSSQQSLFESSQPFSSSQPQESNNNKYNHNNQGDCGRSIRPCSAATAAQFPDAFSDDVLHSQGGGDCLGVSDADDDEGSLHQSHHQPYQVAQGKPSTSATGHKNNSNDNLSLTSDRISSPSCPESNHSATTKHHHHHQRQRASFVIGGEEEGDEGEDEHGVFTQVAMTTSAHNRLQHVLSSAPTPPHHCPLGASRRRAAPTTPKNPPRLLKRSSSIRLSTSLEGKASVVLEDEPSSPPPPPPPPLTLPAPKIQPSSVSRSALKRRTIDSKVWEFCCDNQAVIRSPCQPHEEPSEVTGALGLVRGRGGGSAHKPLLKNGSIGNSLGMVKPRKHLQKAAPSSPIKAKKSRKVISAKSARPKPVLSNNVNANLSTPMTTTTGSSKKPRANPLLPEPGQDSDKENRPPGALVSPPPEHRRALGVPGKGDIINNSAKKKRPADKNKTPRKKNKSLSDKQKRRVLEETRSEGMRIFYDVPPTSSQVCETEYELPGAGGESQSFFDGSSQGSVVNAEPGRVDEMECVENLLSLRGGVWG
ncbi:hypothetical protein HOY82DRAFT_650953 [Tuber indicum]|nr:hypothetical protein HOY82DRAFT_650953 [Tuber indicum]